MGCGGTEWTPALTLGQNTPQQTQPLQPDTPQESKDQQNLPSVGPLSAEEARAAAEKVDSVLPDLPTPPPISGQQVPAPAVSSPSVQHAEASTAQPVRDQATGLRPSFLGFLGPYRRPHVPELFPGAKNGLLHLFATASSICHCMMRWRW